MSTTKQGIKINYATMRDPNFVSAINKLSTYSFRNALVGYNVARLIRKQAQEAATNQELYVKMVRRHAVLTETGQFVPKKTIEGADIANTFTLKEGVEEALEKDFQEYIKIEVELPFNHISPEQLEDVGLTPREILAVDMLFKAESASEVAA